MTGHTHFHGQGAQQPALDLLGVENPYLPPQGDSSGSKTRSEERYTSFLEGPTFCHACRTLFSDAQTTLAHVHMVHGQPPSPFCLCTQCRSVAWHAQNAGMPSPVDSVIEELAYQYTVHPEGSPGDHLSYLAADANVWEDNLPAYMGKLEAGTFSTIINTKKWSVGSLTKGIPLNDRHGRPQLSRSTGNQLRDLPFLPKHIPQDVSAWRLMYWERKAAEQGIKLDNRDIVDRMAFAHQLSSKESKAKENSLSMRMQRCCREMGYLQPTQKSRDAVVFKQNMETLENLNIMQAKLNTVWLPTHMLKRGPWAVVQPKVHPQYKHTNAQNTNYQGTSYIVEQMYGLSDRVRQISDWMVFLDVKAQEAGLEADGAARATMLTRLGDAAVGEFEHWRDCFKHGCSITEMRIALQNALTEEERQAIMDGDTALVEMLQGPSF